MMVKRLKKERAALIICLVLSMIMHLAYGIEGMKQMEALEQQNNRQAAQLQDKQEQIEVLEIILKNQEQDASETMATEPEKEYIGEFEITYYTAGPESTGKSPEHPAYGITRSGTTVEEGRTIAADWSVLPEGTKVFIDGIGERIVEDTGGLIVDKCIDVYVEDVKVARQLGRHKADVWLVEDNYD
jgi:3D (Asp-Asp-Asp) domain-containing protein